MTDRLTPQREAEIQQRAEAATPGPWEEHTQYGEHFYAYLGGSYLRGVGTLNFGEGEDAEADKALTVNAREDIRALLAELAAVRAEREESQQYAALLEVELCQCEPLLETGEYMHEATCPVVEIQMRTLGCPGFEGNPVAPGLCAGCHEPRENHAPASQDGAS
jgi:hypothetical protein